jgi:hypothetical protein
MLPMLPIFKAIAPQGFASNRIGITSQFGVSRFKEQGIFGMITLSI